MIDNSWDWNRLSKVYADDGDTAGTLDANDTLRATYRYNGLHRRVRRILVGDDGNSTPYDYYYNTNWQVLEVRKHCDTVAFKQYVWDIRYIDAPVLRWCDNNNNGTFDANAAEVLYYCTGANFNVTALVDANTGKAVERYLYDPYGLRTVLEGNDDADPNVYEWAPDGDNRSDYDNDLGHQGLPHDLESGLISARNRYLGPVTGKWRQRDPLGPMWGPSLYECCWSNPEVFVDPDGEHPLLLIVAIVALTIASQTEIAWAPSGQEDPEWMHRYQQEHDAARAKSFVAIATLPVGGIGYRIGVQLVGRLTTNLALVNAGGAVTAAAAHKLSRDAITGDVVTYGTKAKEHAEDLAVDAALWFVGGLAAGTGELPSKGPKCVELEVRATSSGGKKHTFLRMRRAGPEASGEYTSELHFGMRRPAIKSSPRSGTPVAGRGAVSRAPTLQASTVEGGVLITEAQAAKIQQTFTAVGNKARYLLYSPPGGIPGLGQNCTSAVCRALNSAGIGGSGLLTGPYRPASVGKALTGGQGFRAGLIRSTFVGARHSLQLLDGLTPAQRAATSEEITAREFQRLLGVAGERQNGIGVKFTVERVR